MCVSYSKLVRRSYERVGSLIVTALLLLILGPIPAAAQQITGSLVGVVKDATGALIPQAKITATNSETGLSRSAQSDSDGNYRIDYLPVGRYSVSVEAAGFQKTVQENVPLAVDQIQTINAALSVGAATQAITVTTAPPLINTSTADLGRTVRPEEVIELPLVNRNVYTELSLTAGVQSNSASELSNPTGTPNFQIGVPSTQVVVNGGIDEGVPMVTYYLDGGINMTGLRSYGNPLPNPDALEEFRVDTSNFSAQYGRASSAVVTAVTRSGTNHFHGSLFEFNRNTDFNAYPWNAPKNPATGAAVNNPYHRNQFGGTVGGPVKKNDAFFFFSYAGLRQSVGQLLSGAIPPTNLQRLGDFTQNVSKTNPVPNMPGTKTPVSGTNTSPNCQTATVGCIPSSLLDKTAANIMTTYIPLPNSGSGWLGYYTTPTRQDEYLGKYDQVLGTSDHIAVSYFSLNTVSNAYGNGNLLWSVNQSFAKQQNVNLSDLHTFTPTVANQVWGTFTRVAGGRANLPAVSLGQLGSSFTIQGAPALPALTASGFFTVGGAFAGPVSDTDFYSLRDVVSTTKGKHSLDFGAELTLEHDMFVGELSNFGSFSFSTAGPTTTGNALADFVTGQVASMEQDTPYHGLLSNWYYAFFVQDNFRLRHNLSINFGLRYDVQTPPTESQNLTATFVPGVQSTTVPNAPLGLLFPGDAGVSRGISPLEASHVSPRIGIVLDPFGDGKTAIRAAAGMFYGSVTANEWNQPANAQPFAVRQTFSSIASLTNVYGNPASFPNGDPFPYTYSPSNPRFLPAASVETISQHYRWPLTYQINASVEQQLPGQLSLLIAYVGNLEHFIPFTSDANYPAWAPGASTSQTSINARRPYDPGVLGQVQYLESNVDGSFHSLQVVVHRPLTRSFTLNGFYVWSHSLESADGSATGIGGQTQDYRVLSEERGPTDFDRRNMASMSGIWNINYYHGHNMALRQISNGWTISPIVYLYSGTPINITTGTNNNDDSYGNNRPNLVPGQQPFLSAHRPRSQAAAQWFNTAAFTQNGPGLGIGIGGADGNTPRDFITGPGYRNIDIGLLHDFDIEHGVKLQLRAEATNAFNMVSLGNPTASLTSANNGKIISAQTPRILQIGARLTF